MVRTVLSTNRNDIFEGNIHTFTPWDNVILRTISQTAPQHLYMG